MKKLLTVADAFEVMGRGLVVVPGPLETQPSKNRERDADLRYRDGSSRMARVQLQHVFADQRLGIIFPFLQKADVPVGTEVWCIDEPKTGASIERDLSTLRLGEPWRLVSDTESAELQAALARELLPKHPLHGRSPRAVARRGDSDDVLFLVQIPTAALAVVHLTRKKASTPRWPHTTVFESFHDWVARCVKPDEG